MLGAANGSQRDKFCTRATHEALNVYYTSQSYFGLPRQSIRNRINRIKLFKETLRDVEIMYKNIGGYDMNYAEFKKICR